MTIRYSVKADFAKLGQRINLVGGKHTPFVTAKTLTDLAGEVNIDAIMGMCRVLTTIKLLYFK